MVILLLPTEEVAHHVRQLFLSLPALEHVMMLSILVCPEAFGSYRTGRIIPLLALRIASTSGHAAATASGVCRGCSRWLWRSRSAGRRGLNAVLCVFLNGSLWHLLGDVLFHSFSARISGLVREHATKTGSKGWLFGRTGGSRFSVRHKSFIGDSIRGVCLVCAWRQDCVSIL